MANNKKNARRAVLAATIGTSLEWYDYFLYGTMSIIVFPTVFFSTGDALVSTLVSVSSFGLGFVVRPLGAFIFGRVGDRYGRRNVLMITLILMGVSTLIIAFTPAAATIGIAAPIIVVVARMLQGLSAGGEWGGAILTTVESSPDEASLGQHQEDKAGFFSSFVQAASPIGLALSNAAILLTSLMGPEAFMEWGWRIPFAIGGVIAIVGIWIRLTLEETAVFEVMRDTGTLEAAPIASAFRKDLVSMILVALAYTGVGTIFYVAVIFGQSFALSTGLVQADVSLIIVVFAVALAIATILVGKHSDRIGHRRAMLIGLGGCAIYTPFWILMFMTGNLPVVLLAFVILAVIFAYCWAPMGAFFARAMSLSSRSSSLSIGYQIGTILGGAIPPILAVWIFGTTGSIWFIVAYIVVTLIISFIASVFLAQRTVAAEAREMELV